MQPPEKTTSDKHADAVVLLLAGGILEADLREACAKSMGLAPQAADAVIAEARKRITLAADFHRDTELGLAITGCKEIHRRSVAAADNRTALAALKELSRLMNLHQPRAEPGQAAGGTEAAAELAAVAEHLHALKLAPVEYPLREHARIAADRIRELTS